MISTAQSATRPTTDAPVRMLFTGYALVHFACIRPLYERLRNDPRVTIHVSGGIRTKRDDGSYDYDLAAMYKPFGLRDDEMLTVDELQELDFDVLFAGNTKLIEPRSVGRRIQIFHGISFRNRAIRVENMKCDHYFLVGPYMQKRFADAGLLEVGDPRGVPIGFVKTDGLLDGSIDRADMLSEFGFAGDRPVLLYAPTGQKKNSLETMGEKVIERIVAADRFDLVIKPHDHPKKKIDWFKRLAHFAGDHCCLSRNPDVVPLLHAADVLISDASSVTSEYSLLNRPTIFLDVPELLERSRSLDNSMMDLDTWGRSIGPIVPSAKEIVATIDAELANPGRYAAARQAMSGDLFFNPGRATTAAMEWIEAEILGEPASRPMTAESPQSVESPA